ncbi:MAG: RiPP maturation radical SAM C-methyltransferase [Bacteroidota bacterium]
MKIKLIVPPPASLKWPSIGLTQIKGRCKSLFPSGSLTVEIEYLNFPFARFIGGRAYDIFTRGKTGTAYFYLEWFFRKVAFPGERDSQDQFFEATGLDMYRAFVPRILPEDREKILLANELLDLRPLLEEHIDKTLEEFGILDADLVGFTSMFNQNVPMLAYAKRLKHHRPEVPIVVGGSNCELPMGMELIKNYDWIDFVFSGPALVSFPAFIENLLTGDDEANHRIDGVFSMRNAEMPLAKKEKSEKKPPVRPTGKELPLNERIPLDYDDFLNFHTRFQAIKLPTPGLFFESSRGCWWGEKAHCTFCGLNANSMMFREVSYRGAQDQILELVERYGDRVEEYAAVDNIMPTHFPEKVFRALKPKYDVDIFYEVKSDLTFDQLSMIKAAGVKSLQPGIEAIDNEWLKLMKKGITSTKNILFLKNATSLGMNLMWNLLFGFPNESEGPYKRTLEAIPSLIHLHPPSLTGPVLFCRFSPYHSEQERYNLELEPGMGIKFLYPGLSDSALENLTYYFSDTREDSSYKHFSRKYSPLVFDLFQEWEAVWYEDTAKEVPQLYFEGNSRRIFDSRSGEGRSYAVSEVEWELLKQMEHPVSVTRLLNNFRDKDAAGLELERLIQKKLVFHDQGRSFISLVMTEAVSYPQDRKPYSIY